MVHFKSISNKNIYNKIYISRKLYSHRYVDYKLWYIFDKICLNWTPSIIILTYWKVNFKFQQNVLPTAQSSSYPFTKFFDFNFHFFMSIISELRILYRFCGTHLCMLLHLYCYNFRNVWKVFFQRYAKLYLFYNK